MRFRGCQKKLFGVRAHRSIDLFEAFERLAPPNNEGIAVGQEQLLEKKTIFWEPQRHQALPYSTTFWDFMALFGFGRHSMPKRNQVPVTQNWKTRNALHTLWSCNYLQPDFQNPIQGLVRGSTSRTRVFALVQASFDCFALHHFAEKSVYETLGRADVWMFLALDSVCFWVGVCASGAVLLRIPKTKPMSFQMSSLSDKSHIGLSWRFCSYSTSRKILRHPKLEQGTLREGLGPYGARWGWGLTRTALHWSSGSTRLRRGTSRMSR